MFIHYNFKHHVIVSQNKNDNHYLWIHLEKFTVDIGSAYKPGSPNGKTLLIPISNNHRIVRELLLLETNYNLLNPYQLSKITKKTILECDKLLTKVNSKYCARETTTTKTILDHVLPLLERKHFPFCTN